MNLHPITTKIILLLAVLIPAVSAAADIAIHDAWINQTPPGTDVTAGYFQIENSAATDIKLENVSSPDFDSVAMHRTAVIDGIARMSQQDSVTIPAHASLAFKPGDYHLMLFKPRKQFTAGDTVSLTFQFSDATIIHVTTTVRQPESGHEDHGQHQNH